MGEGAGEGRTCIERIVLSKMTSLSSLYEVDRFLAHVIYKHEERSKPKTKKRERNVRSIDIRPSCEVHQAHLLHDSETVSVSLLSSGSGTHTHLQHGTLAGLSSTEEQQLSQVETPSQLRNLARAVVALHIP